MKMQRTSILAAFLILFLGACASWKSTSYKSTGTVVITADAAMQSWASYVAGGHATPAQEAAVRDAYGKYQKSMLAVIDAGKSASTSTNTSGLSLVVGAAAAAQADLVGAIRAFLPSTLQPKAQ